MACKLLNLGQRFGNVTKNYYLYQNSIKISSKHLKTSTVIFSSISTDSSLEQKPGFKKKSKHLSTNVIHVGEAVSDGNAKVKRLRASEIPKINRATQNLNKENGSEVTTNISASPITATTSSTASTPTNTFTVNEEEDTVKETEDATFNDFFTKISEEKAFGNDILEGVKSINEKTKKKLSKKEKILIMYEELRHKGRIQSFNHSLAAYLSVCINSGFINSAYQTFNHYIKIQNRQGDLKKFSKLLNIMPYNEILKGIASQGDFKKMNDVREHLIKSSLEPTHDTFAHILTCLGKVENTAKNVSDIKSTLQWMDEKAINLNDMFEKSLFWGDSRKYCLKAVERVLPDIKDQLDVFNPTPEYLQKKFGYKNRLLDPLNDSMFSNKVSSPAEGVLSREELTPLINKQIEQELKGHVQIPTIYVEELSESVLKNRDLLDKWKAHWRKSLHRTVATQKNFMSKNFLARKNHTLDFYPYFHSLDNEEIVNLLMLEINNLCLLSENYSSSLSSMYMFLGDEFFNRFQIKYKENSKYFVSLRKVYDNYCTWYLQQSDSDSSYISRVEWNRISHDEIMNANLNDVPCEWPYTVKGSIGKLLYNIIFSSIVVWKPNEGQKNASPAFYKVHRTNNLKIRDEIKPSPILVEVCRGASQKTVIFSTGTLPMLSPPVPWTDIDNGGYFASKSAFVRVLFHATQQKRMMREGVAQNLYPVMDSLNQLGSIPWKINKSMLDILIEVFNNKGWEEMEISPPPSELPSPSKVLPRMSSKEKREAIKQRMEYRKRKMEMNSLWCDTLYKLSLANFYRDYVIWLPQNMDFRGRTYPIPPHMTHISSDVFRSLLLFAQGKKLGEEGLHWLKLHIINLTGMKKKCSLQERLDFFEEVKDEIFDSAKNPLTGNKWWTQSDEPWQTLSACKELVAALESDKPKEYVSYLPIHQDGSCNGLQHYAALGRDQSGAESVNLRPRDAPQDVYSRIADLVEIRRQTDAKKGIQIAKELDGYVKRKVIKQTVMTTVYGVTKYGARLQILKQLKYMNEFPDQHQIAASSYLCAKTFDSLGSIFSATKEIQNWLVKVAEGVSKGCLKNVEWITPLGFPVVQPYSKNIKNSILSGKIISSFDDDLFLKPNVMKQKNGFPPNFIHSLDSSHMMLTSIHCQHAGITFVSVHDCFWTHASTVPIMSKICREEFVKLHSEPILEDMANYMAEKYSNHVSFKTVYAITGKDDNKRTASLAQVLQCVPQKGEFDIKEVLNSIFFFS